MSVSFYGMAADGRVVSLDLEDAAHLNIANCNARAFLLFLGLEAGEHLDGQATLPVARRAIMRARACIESRVRAFTRPGSETARPGRARFIEAGVDERYFRERLASFERFLNAVAAKGATSISWG